MAWKKCWKIFLEAIFSDLKKLFFKYSVQDFCHHFTWYHWLKKNSHCLSTNHNPELPCVLCTGVTLFFAPVLHLDILLSANQNQVFFLICYLTVYLFIELFHLTSWQPWWHFFCLWNQHGRYADCLLWLLGLCENAV